MIIDEPKHYQKHATTRNPYIVLFGFVTVAGYLPFVSDMAYGVYNLSEMDSKTKEGVYVLADVPSEEYGCVFVFAAKTHFIFQILLSANKAKFRRCHYGQTFDGIEWVVLN